MFKRLLAPLLLLNAAVFPLFLNASHVPGGNITYECVGPNQYMVTLTLFEDCGTAFEGNFAQNISLANSCGYPAQTLSLNNTIYQQNVSQLCPAQMGSSECNGGTLPGVYMHQWSALVTLPGPCDSWIFSYTSCCRNIATNSSNQDSYYWQSVLNSQTAPCNNSAQITAQPIPYVCVNQAVNFNMGAIDPDGNALEFSFINAMSTGSATSILYSAGYSGANPINGATINPSTGQISFTPTTIGNFIFAVLVEEFDANGNLVGSVIQDFQFEVINCVNQVPTPPAAGISGFTGGGTVTSSNTIEVCEGDSFCFNLIFTDSDPTNVLTVTSNIQQSFPGATVTLSGTNPVTATVCATVNPGSPSNSIISFEAEDNACPIPGIIAYPISISVISSTYAGPDVTICLGQGTQLNASGGSTFNWSVVSGDPMNASNFSCNPCADPVANPAVTTTYAVSSNLSGGCNSQDTVTVTVVPDFTYVINQSSGTSCLQDPVNVSITTNPSTAGYTFDWTPTTYLSPSTGPNVSITATVPGTYTYDVTMTSPQGCVKTDQVSITVAAAYPPVVTALASDTNLLCGETTQLTVDLGGGVPSQCGLSTSGGCASTTAMTIGTNSGQNTSTSWPSPYGNWYANARHQFLYTAAELNAMGFVGGKINSITWQTTAQNGATATFNAYTIKIGCTSATSLTTTTGWLGGLSTVFGPQNINVVLGNNTHNFSTAYEWDGTSNIVVEICYNWSAQYSYTYNWSVPYTTTAATQAIFYYSDGVSACSGQNPFVASTFRPVTTFNTCPSIPNPANYTYQWTPGAPVTTTPNSQTTIAVPTQPTTFQVLVTDINGGCTGTSSVYVFADCCQPPTPVISNVSCNGASDGSITATMNGTGPFTVNWFDNSTGTLLQTTNNVTTSDQLNGIPAGTYLIQVINSLNCTEDTIVTVTEPSAVLITANNDTTICSGVTVNLSSSASGGTPGYTYTWSNGTTGASNPVAPVVTTTYQVFATDNNGCVSNTEPVTITVNPIPLATPSSNSPVCEGDTLYLTAATVAGASYSWTGPNGFTSALQNPIIAGSAASNAGSYSLTVSSNGCISTPVATNVIVNPVPVVVASSNSPVCEGSAVNFNSTAIAGAIYSWSGPNGFTGTTQNPSIASATLADGGTYTVTTTLNGCESAPATTNVVVNPVPVIAAAGNTPLCEGSDINLTATLVPGAAYSWTGPNGFLSGIQNPVITAATPAASGVYSVTATAAGCTSLPSQVTITVNPTPVATPSSNSPICEGSSLSLNAANVAGASYNWTGPNGFSSALQNPVINPAALTDTGTYSLTVSVNGCTSLPSTVNVTVNPIPVVTAFSNAPICIGEDLNLTSTAISGATYSWTGPNGFTSSVQNPVLTAATASDAGSYTVTAQLNGCVSSPSTVNVNINSAFDPTIDPAGPFCEMDPSVTLTAADAGGTWSGNGVTSAGTFDPALAGAGTHIITYNIPGSCGGTDTVSITVIQGTGPGPQASQFNTGTNGSGGTVPAGGNDLNWQVSNSLTGPYSPAFVMSTLPGGYYSSPWPDAAWIAHNTDGSHTGNEDFYYSISFDLPCFDECGMSYSVPGVFCVTMDFFTDNSVNEIYINGVPQSPNQPLLPVANQYSNIGFDATGVLTLTLCNDWQPGTNEIVIKVSSGGPYQGFLAQYSTNPPPDPEDPTITAAGNDSSFCTNEPPVQFTAVAPSGTWTASCGTCVDSSTGIFDPAIAGAGIHTVYFTTSTFCPQTDSIIITVDQWLDATITPAGPFCESNPVVGMTAANPGGTWSGVGITDVLAGIFDPSSALAGTHQVVYSIGGVCPDSDTTFITVNPDMNASITPVGPFCEGDTPIFLTAADTGGTWTGTGILNTSTGEFDPVTAGPGTHTVTYSIPGMCSDVQSTTILIEPLADATISDSGPYCVSYPNAILTAMNTGGIWSGPGIVNGSTGEFSPALALSGTHIITYTIGGNCGATDTTLIQVVQDANAQIIPAGPFCILDSPVNLSAIETGGIWTGNGITDNSLGTFDPMTAGTGGHMITYTISGMCGDVQNLEIIVIDTASSVITPAGPFCTDAAPVTLSAATNGGTWSGTGITNPATGVFDPSSAQPGLNTITYTTAGNCGTTSTANILINSLPVVDFSVDSISGCTPVISQFVNSTASSTDCIWSVNGTVISGDCTGFTHTFTAPGCYDVALQVTDSNGCSNSMNATNIVCVFPYPEANFSFGPVDATILDPVIHFTDLSVGATGYLWDFGGIGSSTEMNPSFTFPPDSAVHTVCLNVVNSNGCESSICQDVIIYDEYLLYAPNAFTADGDGLNDIFLPVINGIDPASFELYIFNRWGELVFESHSGETGWDGSYKGQDAKQDVYVWKVKAKKQNNSEMVEYIGHVTLLK